MERSKDVIYTGFRSQDDLCKIRRQDPDGKRTTRRLASSLKLWNHSPDGFNWGYGGSGPAQTALAILLDYTRDAQLARQLHQPFKWAIVARWPEGGSWSLTGHEISAAITRIRSERDTKEA